MAKTTRRRRLRYSDPEDSRLRRYQNWSDDVAGRLSGTGTGQTFTADEGSDQLTAAGHGYSTGDGPFFVSSDTTLPAGLVASALYWVRVVDANTLTLHPDRNAAFKNISLVDITDAGTGTHTITPADTDDAVTEHLRQGATPTNLTAETDVDNLI